MIREHGVGPAPQFGPQLVEFGHRGLGGDGDVGGEADDARSGAPGDLLTFASARQHGVPGGQWVVAVRRDRWRREHQQSAVLAAVAEDVDVAGLFASERHANRRLTRQIVVVLSLLDVGAQTDAPGRRRYDQGSRCGPPVVDAEGDGQSRQQDPTRGHGPQGITRTADVDRRLPGFRRSLRLPGAHASARACAASVAV